MGRGLQAVQTAKDRAWCPTRQRHAPFRIFVVFSFGLIGANRVACRQPFWRSREKENEGVGRASRTTGRQIFWVACCSCSPSLQSPSLEKIAHTCLPTCDQWSRKVEKNALIFARTKTMEMGSFLFLFIRFTLAVAFHSSVCVHLTSLHWWPLSTGGKRYSRSPVVTTFFFTSLQQG